MHGPLATGRDLALVIRVFAAATFDGTDSLMGTSSPLVGAALGYQVVSRLIGQDPAVWTVQPA